jgi:hypothetical protein
MIDVSDDSNVANVSPLHAFSFVSFPLRSKS